jgi:hypothetical protein
MADTSLVRDVICILVRRLSAYAHSPTIALYSVQLVSAWALCKRASKVPGEDLHNHPSPPISMEFWEPSGGALS